MPENPAGTKETTCDVLILGGGAAGLMCALQAGLRGRKVVALEASNKVGKKILMSGGGRCNFTNRSITSENFICANPHFVKSALSQYTQWDFIDMVERHEIAYHEKQQGQLFCDVSSKLILQMLVDECRASNVEIHTLVQATEIEFQQDSYLVNTPGRQYICSSLVVATGGLSIPSLGGATGQAYKIAEKFGMTLNPRVASLVPFTLTGKWHEFSQYLSGVAVPIEVFCGGMTFSDQLLFTHRGLSGPAILQISNYWELGEVVHINLLPSVNDLEELVRFKLAKPNSTVLTWLSKYFPKSLAKGIEQEWWPQSQGQEVAQFKDAELISFVERLCDWQITPSGTEGYRTAEVTKGGVDVAYISSKTMQVNGQPGLFFIGEALDVTGHLGGYNFQWAWSSGYVAGQYV